MEAKTKSSSGLPRRPAKLSRDPLCISGVWYYSKDAYDKLEAAALKLAEQNEALRKDAERKLQFICKTCWLRQDEGNHDEPTF